MKKYYSLLLIILLSACELIVDVDVPFEKEQITLNTFFNPENIWNARLTLNQGILSPDTIPYKAVENALVVIYEGDSPIDTLEDTHLGFYSSDSGKPVAGKNYEIRISASNYESITAQSHIPLPSEITKFHIAEEKPVGQEGTAITVKFTDVAHERNFYEIIFEKEHEYIEKHSGQIITTRQPLGVESNDPGFDENTNMGIGFLINDVLFNGKEAGFSFKSHDGNISNYGAIFVTVRTVSEAYYNYKLTSRLQENTSGNPFAQPVNVYNNIQNGFGIFAGYSQFTLTQRNSKPRPLITGLSMKSGRPGDHLIIYGENFEDNYNNNHARIAFNGENYFRHGRPVSTSDNQIEVIIPEGAITGYVYFMGVRVAISDEEFEVE